MMKRLFCMAFVLLGACARGGDLDADETRPIDATPDASDSAGGARGGARPGSSSGGSSSGGSSSGGNSSSGGGASSSSSGGGGSSSGSTSIDTGERIEVPAGGSLRTVENCWAVGSGVESVPLGAPLVLDLPNTWHFERALGVPLQNIPGAQLGVGDAGRARLLLPLDVPIEWFLGFAVIEVQQGDDTANGRSCFFDVVTPGWQHARTTHWSAGGQSDVDKDLGVVSRSGGVVVEGYLEGDPYYRIDLVPGVGTTTPVRTTTFDYYGLGAMVFQPTTSGRHSFDLYQPHAGVTYHVHFQVVP